MKNISVYVLSGGVGMRLWPCSTPGLPKQYLKIFEGRSSIGSTIDRVAWKRRSPINLIASRDDAEHLNQYGDRVLMTGGDVLLEPARRNTALAVAVATVHALDRHGDQPILVVPADHQIESTAAFWETIEMGIVPARNGRLVLVGVRPTRPDTGFGYIQVADGKRGENVFDVQRFHEKPDRVTAMGYVGSGKHFWNAGVFLFRPTTVRQWFRQWNPALWDAAESSLSAARRFGRYTALDEHAYAQAASKQFDKAIVERAPRVSMVQATFRWRDLGSWRSLVEATVAPWPQAQ